MAATAEVIEGLKERLRQLQAAPRSSRTTLRTGVEAFDGLFAEGGLPFSAAVELCGAAASGKSSLALRAVASAQKEGKLCAWLDGPGEFYAPAARALGADLKQLLVVRAPVSQLAWAAQQLCRSGAFGCVVLDCARLDFRLGLSENKKLGDAAFRGGALLLLLTSPGAPLDGLLRLSTFSEGPLGMGVEVQRSRQGGQGRRALIPWEAVYPAQAPTYRYVQEVWPARAPSTAPGESFARLKASDLRNGGGGLYGTRPGRDCAFPSFSGAGP